MFCARCGQQIPESEICPLCGRETVLHLEPPPPLAAVAPSPIPGLGQAPVQRVTVGPSGIQGWLLFFCIVLTILSPLFIVFQTFTMLRILRRMPDPVFLLDILRVFYGGVVGVFLWMKRPVALLLLKIYFAAVAIMLVLNTLRQIEFALRYPSSPQLFLPARLAVIGALVGYAVLWFAYFRKSIRVRNTYGDNL